MKNFSLLFLIVSTLLFVGFIHCGADNIPRCVGKMYPSNITIFLNNIPTTTVVVNTTDQPVVLQLDGPATNPLSSASVFVNTTDLLLVGRFHMPHSAEGGSASDSGSGSGKESTTDIYAELPHGAQPDWLFYRAESVLLEADNAARLSINFVHHHHHKVSFVIGRGLLSQSSSTLDAIYYFKYERSEKGKRKEYHGYVLFRDLQNLCSCFNQYSLENAYEGPHKSFGFLFDDYYLSATDDLFVDGVQLGLNCTEGAIVNVYGHMTADAFNAPSTVSLWFRSNLGNRFLDFYPTQNSALCYYTLITGHIKDASTGRMIALETGSQMQLGVGGNQMDSNIGMYMASKYLIEDGESGLHEESSDEAQPVKLFLDLKPTCSE